MIAIHPSLSIRTLALAALAAVTLSIVGCDEGAVSQDRDAHVGHDHASHGDHAEEPSAAMILATHEHDDPNEKCFMCDATKRDQGRLWCKEHVRYEDRCWLCHEELENKDRLYCKEHFLYEDECYLCHPELKEGESDATPTENGEGDDTAAATQPTANASPDPGGLFCKEHGVYEIECGICQPDLAKTMQPGQNLKIRFPSAQSADKAGVSVGQPQRGESIPAIEALCEVQYNLNAMARVTPLAEGVIRKVQRDVGDRVEAGDVLVEVHSSARRHGQERLPGSRGPA